MKILETKGQGGFGIVKVVEHEGKTKALKTFSLNPAMAANPELEAQARKRFKKEAKYQHSVSHPNIVPVIDLFLEEEPPSFTMPLAEASMYDDILSGVVNPGNFIECIFDIMAGLEEIHSVGIYHRDLKPSNVLRFTNIKTGASYYAIGDFGLMSLNQTGITTLTHTGMAKTSDMYTAPEITQDLKYASIQSDIYSLGCMIHDFVSTTKRIPCHEISETGAYADILLGATRIDPSRRFNNIADFRDALLEVSKAAPIPKTQTTEIILEILNEPIVDFDALKITKIADFLASSISLEEKQIVLSSLTIEHIKIIVSIAKEAKFIAKNYCTYIRKNGFNFAFCDTLTGRLMEFMKLGEIDILSEGIFALLYMGTSHNRWYVENKAIRYFMGEIEEKLLKRIIMEIRVDGKKFCNAINHLFYSINYSMEALNPEIQKTIKEVCKI